MKMKSYSQRKACELVGIAPRVYRYQSTRGNDADLRERLVELSAETSSVRLQASAYPVETRRLGSELEKALQALQGREADGSQTRRQKTGLGNASADGCAAGQEPEVVVGLCI